MHLSVHQWIRSAIPDSQQPISPVGFLFLKFPPPPCAVLLVYCINSGYKYVVSDRSAHFFDKHPVVLKFGYPQIRHCDASYSAKSRG